MNTATPLTPSNPISWAKWLLLSASIIALDQWTKALIVSHYQLGDATPVTGFFNIVRAHNEGAAFSFLAGAGGWQRWLFTAIGIVAAVLITWMLKRHAGQRLFSLALALILGGALGNVIDRVWHGHVVDFLDVHFAFLSGLFYGGHFPAFNVADMAISAGAVGLILDEILRWRRSRQALA
ncbi:signal peptidase II [Comamonas serinivorans]|uniref:Lipoprotein signal peptidase n=1 Tax=Comamonas serinivorans TaxID=1082851 RepID=A0A1Y0EMB6_9BURK|nr:signal peptidase II [Comamonas serinivorans]ARU04795.1 signal peptidase II [Comamonas serinivorans]